MILFPAQFQYMHIETPVKQNPDILAKKPEDLTTAEQQTR